MGALSHVDLVALKPFYEFTFKLLLGDCPTAQHQRPDPSGLEGIPTEGNAGHFFLGSPPGGDPGFFLISEGGAFGRFTNVSMWHRGQRKGQRKLCPCGTGEFPNNENVGRR